MDAMKELTKKRYDEQQQLKAATEMRDGWVKMFGREPMPPAVLTDLIVKNGWPGEVFLDPSDFMFMTNSGVSQAFKDDTGPYFYVSGSKVRPKVNEEEILDLSSWEPSRIVGVEGSLPAVFS